MRGGADLIVHTVLVFSPPAKEKKLKWVRLSTARLASSPACESCAVRPCLAAILFRFFCVVAMLLAFAFRMRACTMCVSLGCWTNEQR